MTSRARCRARSIDRADVSLAQAASRVRECVISLIWVNVGQVRVMIPLVLIFAREVPASYVIVKNAAGQNCTALLRPPGQAPPAGNPPRSGLGAHGREEGATPDVIRRR